MEKYLITGGAGFIGYSLIEKLIESGESIRVIDNFSTGKRANLEKFKESVEVIEADLRNADAIQKALKNVDVIIHLAAIPSVIQSIKDPYQTSSNNIMSTIQLFKEASRYSNVRRIVQGFLCSCIWRDINNAYKRNRSLKASITLCNRQVHARVVCAKFF